MIAKKDTQAGQSLLIIVLLVAVVFTLIATASYRLTTETQTTKTQEEDISTLAAADSGIETGLRQLNVDGIPPAPRTFQQLGIQIDGIDSSKSKVTVESTTGRGFDSPLINENEQYTFYLSQYDPSTNSFTNHYSGQIGIYYGSNGGSFTCGSASRTEPALEVTLIYDNDNKLERFVLDRCTTSPRLLGDGGSLRFPSTVNEQVLPPDGARYQRRSFLVNLGSGIYPRPKLIIFRTFYESTRIGIRPRNISDPNLPEQGKTVKSEAYSFTGVSKIVTLFQPNPQIPADFFVTTF